MKLGIKCKFSGRGSAWRAPPKAAPLAFDTQFHRNRLFLDTFPADLIVFARNLIVLDHMPIVFDIPGNLGFDCLIGG